MPHVALTLFLFRDFLRRLREDMRCFLCLGTDTGVQPALLADSNYTSKNDGRPHTQIYCIPANLLASRSVLSVVHRACS